MLRNVALLITLLSLFVGDFAMARDGTFSPLRSLGVDPSRDALQREFEREYDALMDRAEANPGDVSESDFNAMWDKYDTLFVHKKLPKLKLPSQGSD